MMELGDDEEAIEESKVKVDPDDVHLKLHLKDDIIDSSADPSIVSVGPNNKQFEESPLRDGRMKTLPDAEEEKDQVDGLQIKPRAMDVEDHSVMPESANVTLR